MSLVRGVEVNEDWEITLASWDVVNFAGELFVASTNEPSTSRVKINQWNNIGILAADLFRREKLKKIKNKSSNTL